MDWEAPAVVLETRPFGEGDAVATVLTEAQGAHRGLARGGRSRAHSALWQQGNIVQVRWVGRLADQLGSFSAELVHPAAALAMAEPLALAMLSAACAVAAGALPERQAQPRVFAGLVRLLAQLADAERALADQVRWEAALLAELGYGLDLASCALTGDTERLAFVSPRTGRAVSAAAAGKWQSRLLRLPAFLLDAESDTADDRRDGLRLTGHFLARDVFGVRHLPLPAARQALYDRVAGLAEVG